MPLYWRLTLAPSVACSNSTAACTRPSLLQHLLRSLATSLYMQHNKLCCSICSNPLPPPYICNTTSFAAAFAQIPCHLSVYATQQALLQHLLRSLATSLYMQHNKLCCSICSGPLPSPYICNTTSFAAAFAQVPCHLLVQQQVQTQA